MSAAPELQGTDHSQADTPWPWNVLTPGSFVIERYTYTNGYGADARTGVQWVVHRVGARQEIEHFKVFKTRREAARFIEAFSG